MAWAHDFVRIPTVHAPRGSHTLRACVSHGEECVAPYADGVMLYLHGFPDMSLCASKDEFASRMPRKLCDHFLAAHPRGAFVCFNASGIPGSTEAFAFHDKSLRVEVADVKSAVAYCARLLAPGAGVHVVGLSTGALLAELFVGETPPRVVASVTALAVVHSLDEAVAVDFEAEQVAAMRRDGECAKTFWDEGERVEWMLGAQYVESYYAQPHSLEECMRRNTAEWARGRGVPLLIVHGDADRCIPVEHARKLFSYCSPAWARLEIIPGANHLLTNSKHMKRMLRTLREHVTTHARPRGVHVRRLVKLGGSAITHKDTAGALNAEALAAVAAQLAAMPDAAASVVVHGAGSFGHHEAAQWNLARGGDGHERAAIAAGVAATHARVRALNDAVCRALCDAGVPSCGVSPCGVWSVDAQGAVVESNTAAVEGVLHMGCSPVLHGDTVADMERGQCAILSGDTIMVQLAARYRPDVVVFVTDVDGVLTAPPDAGGTVIARIASDGGVPELSASTRQHDVTGGILAKLGAALEIARLGIPVLVVRGGSPSCAQALSGRTDVDVGTLLQ